MKRKMKSKGGMGKRKRVMKSKGGMGKRMMKSKGGMGKRMMKSKGGMGTTVRKKRNDGTSKSGESTQPRLIGPGNKIPKSPSALLKAVAGGRMSPAEAAKYLALKPR